MANSFVKKEKVELNEIDRIAMKWQNIFLTFCLLSILKR